ncbi:PEP-CTERM sorting domain-containing protein [Planctomycetota bacterium]
MLKHSKMVLLGIGCVLLFMGGTGEAVTIPFNSITNNNVFDAGIGENQLFIDVIEGEGQGQVTFTFRNEGPYDLVISEIYIDIGNFLEYDSIIENPLGGVDYRELAIGMVRPANLPGGKSINPQFINNDFSIEPENPQPFNGVNPYEELGVVFNLIGNGTFNGVINEIQNLNVRAGIHVIGFTSGGSESFVNVPIPEPMTVCLLGMGSIALIWRRRRQSL